MSLKTIFLLSVSFLISSSVLLIGVTYLYDPKPISIIAAVETNRKTDSSTHLLGVSSSSENVIPSSKTFSKMTVTILLIGIDSRRGNQTPRCDSIHLITFNRKEKSLHLINIPRGTPTRIPGFDESFSIISNACSVLGIDSVKTRIEKMTNLKIDYTIKMGFSQAIGFARLFSLPSIDTLTSLRSRAYPAGDNQRSYNQALFIRDLIGKYLSSYPSFPKPFKYIAFNMLEADVDFETADNLLTEAASSPFATDSSLIPITNYSPKGTKLKDIHLLEKMGNASKSANGYDKEFVEYQQNLTAYLQNKIDTSQNFIKASRKDQAFKNIQPSYSQQLWLQIEDEIRRDALHFDIVKNFALSNFSSSESAKIILDFISEMDQKGNEDLKEKAEEVLKSL